MKCLTILISALATTACVSGSSREDLRTHALTRDPVVFTGRETCSELLEGNGRAENRAKAAESRHGRAETAKLIRVWLTLGMGEPPELSVMEAEVVEAHGQARTIRTEIDRRGCAGIPG